MSTRYNFFGGLVTDGLILNLDAAKLQSYSGSSDNWYDISGNNRNAKLLNGPTFSGFGKQASIFFDGTDDVLSFTATSINNDSFFNSLYTNGLSITTWFTLPSNFNVPNTDGRSILYRGNGGAEANWWHYSLNQPSNNPSNGVRQRFWIGNAGSYSPWVHYGENRLQSGSTYFGTVIWNPINSNQATVRLYLNGSLEYEKITTKAGGISLSSANNLGNFPDSGWSPYFNQYALSVYNKAISPFDVFQNYNAYKYRFNIPDIVTSGLTLNLDAGNPYSYNPDNTSTTTWVDTTYLTTGGTLTNGAFYSGGTMVFDGVDDWVTVNNTTGNFGTGNFTIDLIFKTTTTLSPRTFFAKSIGDTPTVNYGWLVNQASSGELGFATASVLGSYGDVGTYSIKTNGGQINDGRWKIVSIVGDKLQSNVTIYINGIQQTLQTYIGNNAFSTVGNITNTQTLRVGAESDNSLPYPINSNISLARLYNRALSQAEITQNFNALRGRYGI
jgi:hypothetical protein